MGDNEKKNEKKKHRKSGGNQIGKEIAGGGENEVWNGMDSLRRWLVGIFKVECHRWTTEGVRL